MEQYIVMQKVGENCVHTYSECAKLDDYLQEILVFAPAAAWPIRPSGGQCLEIHW